MSATTPESALDAVALRRQFPILNDPHLVYLDSAASSQKPEAVLQAMDSYYRHDNANVQSRGVYALAERSTRGV
ncbi:MAG: aminotransferase class V-fold PLP-dependent enzyme [Thermomicrobiales bacterium]|nr:aminotransferase class V-fold PLP-dependent enzyme [Thermomicrobiales bacterium]